MFVLGSPSAWPSHDTAPDARSTRPRPRRVPTQRRPWRSSRSADTNPGAPPSGPAGSASARGCSETSASGPAHSARTTSPRSDPIQIRPSAGGESADTAPEIGTRRSRTRCRAPRPSRRMRNNAVPEAIHASSGPLRIAPTGRSPSRWSRSAGSSGASRPPAVSIRISPRAVPTSRRSCIDPRAVIRRSVSAATVRKRPLRGSPAPTIPPRDVTQSVPSGLSVIRTMSSAGRESGLRAECRNVRNACACGSKRLTPPFQLPIQRLPTASS
jgi:hypothetical protein